MTSLKTWLDALPADPNQRPGRLGYMRAEPPTRCWVNGRAYWLRAAFEKTAVVSETLEGVRSVVRIEHVWLADQPQAGLTFYREGDAAWHRRRVDGTKPREVLPLGSVR